MQDIIEHVVEERDADQGEERTELVIHPFN